MQRREMKAVKDKRFLLNIPVIFLMAGMFFVLLFMLSRYQEQAKSSVSFFVTGCLMTMAGTLVLSICFGSGSMGKNRKRNMIYQLLMVLTYLGVFFAGICFLYLHIPGKISVAAFFYSLEGVTTAVLVFFLLVYDQTYFDIQKKAGKVLLTIMFVITLADIAIILSNNFGWFFLKPMGNDYFEYTPLGIGVWITIVLCLTLYTVLSFFCVKDKRTRFFLILNKTGPTLWMIFEVLAYYGMETSFGFLSNFSTFLTLLLMFCFVYIEDNRRMAAQERELSSLRLNSLRAQINPHFVYNTLGTIADMCNTDPKEAEELIYEFSDYLRDNFSDVERQPVHYFSEEMKHVRHYLLIEQKRFPNIGIEYDIKARDFMIPAMTLQPVIENSIKHGICARRKSSGTIKISSEEREKDFLVTVEDDGVGFDTSPEALENNDEKGHHHGIGLQNTRKRLEMICGGSLEINSTPGKGTKCYIILPKDGNRKGEK